MQLIATRLGASSSRSSVTIRIDDHGPGLPPGREEALFDKFERGSKESAMPGVGLGLAISRAIVQAHQGSIRAENRTGPDGIEGARFTIELPRGKPPADDGSSSAAGRVQDARMELRARILVVEDEPDIRRFVRMALESEGHEVFEAPTLQRGLI